MRTRRRRGHFRSRQRRAADEFASSVPDGYKNLWDLPNLLLQKFPAEEFTATAKVKLNPRFEGERFGLVVMGLDYSLIGVTNRGGKLYISQATAKDADKGTAETEQMPSSCSDQRSFIFGLRSGRSDLQILATASTAKHLRRSANRSRLAKADGSGRRSDLFSPVPANSTTPDRRISIGSDSKSRTGSEFKL